MDPQSHRDGKPRPASVHGSFPTSRVTWVWAHPGCPLHKGPSEYAEVQYGPESACCHRKTRPLVKKDYGHCSIAENHDATPSTRQRSGCLSPRVPDSPAFSCGFGSREQFLGLSEIQ